MCCAKTVPDGDVMTQQVRLRKGKKKCCQYTTAARNGISTLYARNRRCCRRPQRKPRMCNDDKMRLLGYVCLSYEVKESYLLSLILFPLRLRSWLQIFGSRNRRKTWGSVRAPGIGIPGSVRALGIGIPGVHFFSVA